MASLSRPFTYTTRTSPRLRHLLRPLTPTASFTTTPPCKATSTPSPSTSKRTAIVTGAARGIGKAIALRLARDGYDLCINDIPANTAACEAVAQEIRSLGQNACVAPADISHSDQADALVQTSVKHLGPLNTFVANAGIAQVKPLLDLTNADFERIFRVNVFGCQNCYRAAARQLIAQGTCTPAAPGKLIGAASIVAFKPFALLSHYSASKWAVRGLTQAYAMEMAEHHITVNAYAPGIVGTDMWELIDEGLGKKKGAKKGDTIKKYAGELIALGRVSVPEDVAKHVSFLASPDSDYVTGQTQVVDGESRSHAPQISVRPAAISCELCLSMISPPLRLLAGLQPLLPDCSKIASFKGTRFQARKEQQPSYPLYNTHTLAVDELAVM